MHKKYLYIFFLFFMIIGLSSLGKVFDISKQKYPVDILVSLGGDNGLRIKKTLSLYDNNMSKSNKIILTGVDNFDTNIKIYELDWRASYLVKKGVAKDNIIYNTQAENTLQEVLFIKQYMLEYDLHSVIFITDPPHTKRIGFFASTIAKYEDNNLSYILVATDNSWWDKDRYYTNPEAVIYIINESIKYIYYYIQYMLGNLNAQ